MGIYPLRRLAAAAVLGTLLWLGVRAQDTTWKLAAVQFQGLHINRPETAVEASGLQIGQAVTKDDLNAAAQRLIDSGLFSTLRYRYIYRGEDLTVIFTVEEQDVRVPVVFDNFVWFSDEEIVRAIRSQLPRFNGTALPSGSDTAAIREGLRLLLHEKDVRSFVEVEEVTDPDTQAVTRFIVRAQGAVIPICGLRFPGAGFIPEFELLKTVKSLIGSNYSRSEVAETVDERLLPLYHRTGRLRAEFQTPTAQPIDHPQCPDGVIVSVPVSEGYSYTWDRAEWTGASLLTDEELDRLLGLTRGEVADSERIEAGLEKIRAAYRAKAKNHVQITGSPLFEDDLFRVVYRVTIVEE